MSVVSAAIRATSKGFFEIGIASDRQANYGNGFCSDSPEKLIVLGREGHQFIVGVVGSFRFRDLISERDWGDAFNNEEDVNEFREGLIELSEAECGRCYASNDDLTYQLILACRQGLYTFYSDMQKNHHEVYCAIGTGAEVACGSLHSLTAVHERPFRAADVSRRSAEAACDHRVDCGLGVVAKVLKVEEKRAFVESI